MGVESSHVWDWSGACYGRVRHPGPVYRQPRAVPVRMESLVRVRPASLLMLVSAMVVTLGAASPWLSFTGGSRATDVAGTQVQMSQGLDGRLVFAGGVTLVVLAALMMVWRSAGPRALGLLVAVATLAAAAYDWYRLHQIVSGGLVGTVGGDVAGRAGLGYGVYVTAAAALVTLMSSWAAAR